MKIYHINKLFALLIVAMLWSCDDSDDNTGDSTLEPTTASATISMVTLDGDPVTGAVSIDEMDTSFVINVTLSETQIVDVKLNVFMSDGTASEGDDFDVSTHQIVIPRDALTGSVQIDIYSDDVTTEEDETFTITVGDDSNKNVTFTPFSATFTLANTPDYAVNDYIEIMCSWGAGISTVDGEDVCDVVDLDFFLLPEGSGSTEDDVTEGMATGSCPEYSDIDLADGVYNLYSTVWSNGTTDYGDYNFEVPVTVTLTRYANDGSVISSTIFVEDPSVAWSTADQDDAFGYMGDIVVENGEYSFTDGTTTTGKVRVNLEGSKHQK